MNADACSTRSTQKKVVTSPHSIETDSAQKSCFAWWTWGRVGLVVFLSIVLVWRGNDYVPPGSGPTLLIPLITALSAIIFVLTALAWALQKTSDESPEFEQTPTV
jgi:hypothetical protein